MSGLDELSELTAMVLEAELSALRAAGEACAGPEVALRALTEDAATRLAALAEGPDLAHLAGADGKWQLWAQARRRELSQQLAKASAVREAQLARTRKAFGRHQALRELARRAR